MAPFSPFCAAALFYPHNICRKKSKKRKKKVCNCPICSGHLKLQETIGEGAFGVVRKCTSKDEVNVVKMIKVDIRFRAFT